MLTHIGAKKKFKLRVENVDSTLKSNTISYS